MQLHGEAPKLVRLQTDERSIVRQCGQPRQIMPVSGDGVRAGTPLVGQLGKEGGDRGVGGHECPS